MYNRLMKRHIPLILISAASLAPSLFAQTAVRDSAVVEIARHIWNNRFSPALHQAKNIQQNETDNPLGYFLVGTVYQTISEEYRTDRFSDLVEENLSKAIKLAEKKQKKDKLNPDWPFIEGAAHSYRALHRAFHGDWWGAFKDGFSTTSGLNKALELDSSYYDAYLGLGAYDYYKTVKAKAFLWLGLVGDKREEGISKIRIAIAHGALASHNARESLMRIYFEEKRYADVIPLADSIGTIIPDDTYCLLYATISLIELGQVDSAAVSLERLRTAWQKSGYFDPLGMHEADYVEALLLARRGENDMAEAILDTLLDKREFAKSNAYFKDTLERAAELARSLK